MTFLLSGPVFAQSYSRPTYSSPIAISRDDQLIWVVNPEDNSVSVIRPDNNTRIAKIPVGTEPQSIALTPNGQYAYAANAAGNSVTIIHIDDPAWASFSVTIDSQVPTGAEPWNIVTSPDGQRVFVANSGQDTVTVLNAVTRTIIGHVDLRNSLANDPDRSRHFQPRGLAVTLDNTKLYVTRFLSFTKAGGRQGDDLGKEGLVAVLNINTASPNIADYSVARVVALAPQITGFKFPGLTNPPAPDTLAFPNQLQSIVIRGGQAYLPNIAASPTGPLRFNLDTHAFVSVIDGVTGITPTDAGTNKFLNLHLGARDPEPGKRREFFANPWAIAFTSQSGSGNAYAVSAGSDLLVKLNVGADGRLAFTGDSNTTRYLDLHDPTNPNTSGVNAGKNPQGIAINSTGTRAYVANFVSRNISVVDLTTDTVIGTVPTSDLPAPGSAAATNLVGAEMFFSSRGNFDSLPGTNSFRDRLSSEGWQSCASCHFKGLTDGVVWQFAAGPRKSVPLNATFNPHNRTQQRLLNYSAIFDEVEDFEANIRNVSGPGALAGGALDPNHGLLIGDSGDLNVAPAIVNAFAKANADRAQVTVTLPGSTNKVPALTALREWVRNAVRTPNAPVSGLPNAPSASDIAAGRTLFAQAGCVRCHGGGDWTVNLKSFVSPPVSSDVFTERNPTPFVANPVGVQYLARFLRDVGSFNLGVPGQTNDLGNNIGADEKAAAGVFAGTLLAVQDGLGRDYNGDGEGVGFNIPSLLGSGSLPPYLHNGAAESLAQVVADPKHRTANGTWPDQLASAADQAKVVAFLETIDANTAIFDANPAACTPAPAGLVSWWPGGSNANDIIGNNHGTLMNGATFAAGKVGQAFCFDGVKDYVSVPHNAAFNFSNALTIEAWVKTATSGRYILTKNDDSFYLAIGPGSTTPNKLSFFLNHVSAGWLQGTSDLTDDQWHHVAGTYDGANLKVFVDGNLENSVARSGNIQTGTNSVFIGVRSLASNFAGLLDEVSIYNRALSAAEIQAIYSAGSAGKCLTPVYITSVSKVGNNLNLSWLAQQGVTYQVQSKTNLNPLTPWTAVSGDVTATGSTASQTDIVPANTPQRFYRVELLR